MRQHCRSDMVISMLPSHMYGSNATFCLITWAFVQKFHTVVLNSPLVLLLLYVSAVILIPPGPGHEHIVKTLCQLSNHRRWQHCHARGNRTSFIWMKCRVSSLGYIDSVSVQKLFIYWITLIILTLLTCLTWDLNFHTQLCLHLVKFCDMAHKFLFSSLCFTHWLVVVAVTC